MKSPTRAGHAGQNSGRRELRMKILMGRSRDPNDTLPVRLIPACDPYRQTDSARIFSVHPCLRGMPFRTLPG